ncbi:MAG: hypothetical protein JXR75_13665 [Rhodobacteraceae bacterium]|nr:hypothetical protein [Paracoccaceae bacterium]
MVAYSFQKRFAPQIVAGSKRQTIRAPRRRHARPGEALQLYVGMRTTTCCKIIPDPLCAKVEPITILFDAEGKIDEIEIDRLPIDDVDGFAVEDGFESLSAMAGFWVMHHGLMRQFRGVLISWVPVVQVAQ